MLKTHGFLKELLVCAFLSSMVLAEAVDQDADPASHGTEPLGAASPRRTFVPTSGTGGLATTEDPCASLRRGAVGSLPPTATTSDPVAQPTAGTTAPAGGPNPATPQTGTPNTGTPQNALAAAPQTLNGQQLFRENCASCHPGGRDADKARDRMASNDTEKRMPQGRAALSPSQQAAIVAFLRSR